MIQPPLPAHEETRLAELLSYGVLDTESEQLFDDITQLASEICETPIALISLIDPDRQWFKSKVGLDVSETHRNISFCGHAILDDQLMEVTDTLDDERFADNPLVTGPPNIRFYAGTPLITSTGYALGTLCAIDRVPKTLTDLQRHAMHTLGKSVMAQLELRRQNNVLKKMNTLKARYLKDISQRFQTPLKSICTFSKLLREEARAAELSLMFQHSLGLIEHSGQDMMRAIESVLATDTLTETKDNKPAEHTQTRPFFHHIFHTMASISARKHIRFDGKQDGNVPEHLVLDEPQLGKVLLKVIGNAIHFSEKGSQITMKVHYHNSALIFTVRDHGRGMTEEQLCQSYRNTGRNTLRDIVNTMRGTLKIKSESGSGTLVLISLPVNTLGAKPKSSERAPFPLIDNAKILLLEHQQTQQQHCQALLARFRQQAEVTENEASALEQMSNTDYDLVLLSTASCSEITLHNMRRIAPSASLIAISDELLSDANWELAADSIVPRPQNSDTLTFLLNFYLMADGKFMQ